MNKIVLLISILFGAITASYAQTLNDYYKTALENNPSLLSEYKMFEASLQRAAKAGGLPDPTLSFGYFISPVETRVGPQVVKFSIAQMFPWFGTLKSKKDAMAYTAEANYQSFIESSNKLKYEVASAYFRLCENKSLIKVEQQNIQLLNSLKESTLSKYETGKSNMANVIRVDIMIDDAINELLILEQKKQLLKVKFIKLINSKDTSVIIIPDTMPIFPVPPSVSIDSIIQSHPRTNEIDLRIESARSGIETANRQGLPSFGIGVDYAVVKKRSDMNVPDNGKDIIMPMVSVGLPVFRKKYNSSIRESQLMEKALEYQKEAIANQLIVSYETVGFDIERHMENMKLFKDQINKSEYTLNLLLSEFSTAGVNFEEILRMEQQVLKYRRQLISETVLLNMSIMELNYITANTNQ